MTNEAPPLPGFSEAEPFDTSRVRPLAPDYEIVARERRDRITKSRGEDLAAEATGFWPDLVEKATGFRNPPRLPRTTSRPRSLRRGPSRAYDEPRLDTGDSFDDLHPPFQTDTRSPEEQEADRAAMKATPGFQLVQSVRAAIVAQTAARLANGDVVQATAMGRADFERRQ